MSKRQCRTPGAPAAANGVDGDMRRERGTTSRAATPYRVDGAIARLATAQDGVVTRAQLVRAGLGLDAIDHRVRRGALIVVHRGVYAVGHAALGDRGRLRAALFAAGPSAV